MAETQATPPKVVISEGSGSNSKGKRFVVLVADIGSQTLQGLRLDQWERIHELLTHPDRDQIAGYIRKGIISVAGQKNGSSKLALKQIT